MIDTVRGPLPIHFSTIVVKASAVDRAYPNARDRFIAAFDASSFNGNVFGLVSMGPESVEWHLTRLQAVGIVLGVDAALADMMHGPEVECPGLVFASEGEWFGARWTVDVGEGSVAREPDTQEAPRALVQRVGAPQIVSPSESMEVTPRLPAAPWRRHVVPAGQVFWFGGDEDSEVYGAEPLADRSLPLVAERPTPALAPTVSEKVVILEGYTAEDHYDVLDAGLTDILAHTVAHVDENLFNLLLSYNRHLRIALGLPVAMHH